MHWQARLLHAEVAAVQQRGHAPVCSLPASACALLQVLKAEGNTREAAAISTGDVVGPDITR